MLVLGRRGTTRTLAVLGEVLSKVMYRLIDTMAYQHCDVLVPGGDMPFEFLNSIGIQFQSQTIPD
ncbi:MAG: hypothetical protein NTV54_03720 [Ignavibacteriales bacterium]|nr:hypothetical protein [Ignavibacteriales bacterium]